MPISVPSGVRQWTPSAADAAPRPLEDAFSRRVGGLVVSLDAERSRAQAELSQPGGEGLQPFDARQQLEALDVDAVAIKADVSKEDEVKNMVEEVRQKFGRLDMLVNNAINGLNAMPARGGNPALTDEQIQAAVEYMLQ